MAAGFLALGRGGLPLLPVLLLTSQQPTRQLVGSRAAPRLAAVEQSRAVQEDFMG